jgi:hypothetical protein
VRIPKRLILWTPILSRENDSILSFIEIDKKSRKLGTDQSILITLRGHHKC